MRNAKRLARQATLKCAAVLAAAAISATAAAQQPAGVDVGWLPDAPLPMVAGSLDGDAGRNFVVDTGASGQARIDRAVVDALGMPKVGQVEGRSGLAGQGQVMDLVAVGSIGLAGIEFRDIEAASRDYSRQFPGFPRVDGILGFELFRDWLLVLDGPRRRLRLDAPGGSAPPDSIALLPPYDVPRIDVEVAGRKVAAIIDSGFTGDIQLSAALAEPLLAAPAMVVGRGRTVSGDVEIRGGQIRGDIRVGPHVVRDPYVTIVEGDMPVLLGARFLERFVASFDQRRHLCWLQRDSAEPIVSAPRLRMGVAFAAGATSAGLDIVEVFPGSAGEKAGLRKGDRVLRINGRDAATIPPPELRTLFGAPQAVTFEVRRDDLVLTFSAVPSE